MKPFGSLMAPAALLLLNLVGAPPAFADLLINGDFSAGNSGFSTDYTYDPTLLAPEVYTVDTDPENTRIVFFNIGDHTTGTGNMMIVNGSIVLGQVIWGEQPTSDLAIGGQYAFVAWVASVFPVSPALLAFNVDNTQIGTFTPTDNGKWTEFVGVFTATTARPDLTITDLNTDFTGNDFALDDIGLSAVPEPSPAWLLAGIVGMVAAGYRWRRRRCRLLTLGHLAPDPLR